MIMDDNDGQMIFGDLVDLKLPDIHRTGEEKSWKNLTQKTCPDWESNLGPLRGKHACYHLLHRCGLFLFMVHYRKRMQILQKYSNISFSATRRWCSFFLLVFHISAYGLRQKAGNPVAEAIRVKWVNPCSLEGILCLLQSSNPFFHKQNGKWSRCPSE